MENQFPIILLVYANDRVDSAGHLRNLSAEVGRIRDALKPAESAGLCQVLVEANASTDRLFSVFQDSRYRNRIAILHYAGHANGYQLLLESASGAPGIAHAAGLAAFLGEQRGLQLVFLNGCSTAQQVQGLLDASCPVVIATSQAIEDQAAMDFAVRFYEGLGGGAALESAFNAAVAAINTQRGDDMRALYWGSATEVATLAERAPWELWIKPGADRARHWNLPDAAGDPLFGLPALPRLDLPKSPFRHLDWFEREHAEVFFGRVYQIRELYDRVTASDAPPILLFYGQTGVGKSSVLAAGLLPRLESSHRVHYLRRDPNLGLLGSLLQALDPAAGSPAEAWQAVEGSDGPPLLIVLDQVEEVFTRPSAEQSEELAALVDALGSIFGKPPEARPRGRLILSLRKEWLPEIEDALNDKGLPHAKLFLKTLDRRGIIAAVEGCSRSERPKTLYGLEVKDHLAEEIADDLLADPESPVAPTLQILLSKLWSEAKRLDDDHPRFTHDLYLRLKRDGILLKDFLDQKLTATEQWRAQVAQSGLALDLLAYHTTAKGTAEQRLEQDVLQTYDHVKATLPELVQYLKDGYVLADIPTTAREPVKGSRLAHDTLAPLVRERFERSDRPGQRARRIIESRAVEWNAGSTGTPLDETDVQLVETGASGMRAWCPDEVRLVEASRAAADRRRRARRRRYKAALLAVILITAAGLFAAWQWQKAARQERAAFAGFLASQAQTVAERFPQRALLLATEAVRRPWETDGQRIASAETALRQLLAEIGGRPIPSLLKESQIEGLAVDPKGRWIAIDSAGTFLGELTNPPAEPIELFWFGSYFEFDPKGRWLATTREPQARGGLILWDIEKLKRTLVLWKNPNLTDPERRELEQGRVGLRGYIGPTTTEVVFDPEGKWLAVGSEDGNVRLWNLEDPMDEPAVLSGHKGRVTVLAFDPQGPWLAAGGEGTTVHLWDLGHLAAEPRVLQGHKDDVIGLAFDPQRHRLVTASTDKTVRLWGLANSTAEQVLDLKSGIWRVDGVFDSDGRWFVNRRGPSGVELWNLVEAPDAPVQLHRGLSEVTAFAFDPQGRWLATAVDPLEGDDANVYLSDLGSPKAQPMRLRGLERAARSLAFDAGGHWLAAGTDSGHVRVWELANPTLEPQILRSHSDAVMALVFDPGGRWLATGSRDTIARLWDLNNPSAEPQELKGHEGALVDIAVDPRGRWLATASYDQTARLWDLANLQAEPRVLGGHEGRVKHPVEERLFGDLTFGVVKGGVTTLAFDPQGRWLATGGMDRTARVWNLTDVATDAEAKPKVLSESKGDIDALTFDRKGDRLAIWSERSVRVWDFGTPGSEPTVPSNPPSTRDFPPRFYGLTPGSPDIDRLFGQLWWAPPARGESKRTAVAFDPNGRWLAAGSEDGSVQLWDYEHGAAEPVVLRGHIGRIWRIAFDPKGRWVATAGEDKTVRLWSLDIDAMLNLACSTAGRNLTRKEWYDHTVDRAYQVTCTQFPADEPDGTGRVEGRLLRTIEGIWNKLERRWSFP